MTAAMHSRRISAGLASIASNTFIITRTACGNSKYFVLFRVDKFAFSLAFMNILPTVEANPAQMHLQ